jgi:hypothetical protein
MSRRELFHFTGVAAGLGCAAVVPRLRAADRPAAKEAPAAVLAALLEDQGL